MTICLKNENCSSRTEPWQFLKHFQELSWKGSFSLSSQRLAVLSQFHVVIRKNTSPIAAAIVTKKMIIAAVALNALAMPTIDMIIAAAAPIADR
jgi:hypothetical protein